MNSNAVKPILDYCVLAWVLLSASACATSYQSGYNAQYASQMYANNYQLVSSPPPPPVAECMPTQVQSGSTWVNGYWAWNGAWNWQPGQVVAARPCQVWQAPTVTQAPDGYRYYPGVWRPDDRPECTQHGATPPAQNPAWATQPPPPPPTYGYGYGGYDNGYGGGGHYNNPPPQQSWNQPPPSHTHQQGSSSQGSIANTYGGRVGSRPQPAAPPPDAGRPPSNPPSNPPDAGRPSPPPIGAPPSRPVPPPSIPPPSKPKPPSNNPAPIPPNNPPPTRPPAPNPPPPSDPGPAPNKPVIGNPGFGGPLACSSGPARVRRGEVITITGQNFSAGAVIRIAGQTVPTMGQRANYAQARATVAGRVTVDDAGRSASCGVVEVTN